MEAELLTERADGVALLTMNRPEQLNALGGDLLPLLHDACGRSPPTRRSAAWC